MAANSNSLNYYELLGVLPSATPAEIRQAYKREALRHHPDKNPDRKEEATERFKQLAEAYSVLSDAPARGAYDRGMRATPSTNEGFSVETAFDVFREVYGKRFMAGLARVVKEAAPHVRNAAQATANVVASALDHLNQSSETTHATANSGNIGGAFCRPVDTGSASGISVLRSIDCGQLIHEVGNDMLWLCTLSWHQSAVACDLQLSACLAGCDGLYLGTVDNQTGDAALQFRECGVRHISDSTSSGARSEIIESDIGQLSMNEMFRYLFMRVSLGARKGGMAEGSGATFSVRNREDSLAFPPINLVVSHDNSSQKGCIVLCLVRNKQKWYALQILKHCTATTTNEDEFQEMLASLSHETENLLAKHLQQNHEEKEVANAIAAVVAASGDSMIEIRTALDDKRLVESIMMHAQKGNYTQAVEGQEELIRRLMEYEDRDGDDRWQTRIASEFARMDRLLDRLVSSPGSTSLHSSTAVQGIADSSPPKELGALESLNDVGFQNVVALNDNRAMEVYIRRILESRGGQLWSDADIEMFAEIFIGKGAKWNFDAVVQELFTKGGPAPSGANATEHDFVPPPREVKVAPAATEQTKQTLSEIASQPGSSSMDEPNISGTSCGDNNIEPTSVVAKFESVGRNVKVSDDGRTVTRSEGVNDAVCVGEAPLHCIARGGYYFEVVVNEVCKSIRAIAVGFRAGPLTPKDIVNGHVIATEARQLERVWLAGYDKAGAIFFCDGVETKIPPASWRPVRDTKLGTRLGVSWSAAECGKTELVIYQDGVEMVRLLVASGERLPVKGEDLFAVVDLQGTIRSVSFVQNPSVPTQPQS